MAEVKIDERGILIDGKRIPIVSDAEAEKADAVVCGYPDTPTPFTNNVHTRCAWCRCKIVHRPHAPKKPAKICIECALSTRN